MHGTSPCGKPATKSSSSVMAHGAGAGAARRTTGPLRGTCSPAFPQVDQVSYVQNAPTVPRAPPNAVCQHALPTAPCCSWIGPYVSVSLSTAWQGPRTKQCPMLPPTRASLMPPQSISSPLGKSTLRHIPTYNPSNPSNLPPSHQELWYMSRVLADRWARKRYFG
jgi:hypothetical protein